MTNTEYIRWLKLLDEEIPIDALIDGKDEIDIHEMIWALCEKLEQEPCEDCISRAEAVRIASGYCHWANIADELKKMPSVQPKAEQEPKTDVLDKISAEINEYGSLWVEYKIIGHTDRDIEKIVEDVLKQAKEQVLEIIDKYKAESEG